MSISGLRGSKKSKNTRKRGGALNAARSAGRSLKPAKIQENALEDTPQQSVLRRSENPKKTNAACYFGRFIILPLLRLVSRLKKNKKLRLCIYAGAALLAAGVFLLAALMSSGDRKGTEVAYADGLPASILSPKSTDAAAQSPERAAAQNQNALPTPGDQLQQIPTPSPTPVATTQPEPSVTPVVTVKPSLTPKSTPKPTTEPTSEPTTKPTSTPKPASTDMNSLTNYYKVDAEKYYDSYRYSTNSYNYTEEEVLMLARVITREAGSEKYEGMLAVGNVVMNRVFSGHWGSTIESVVTAKKQFSYKPDSTPKQKCIDAARDVLKYERWVVPQNVYFFHSGRTPGEDWGRYKYSMKIGGHCFYTHKIGSRYMGDSIPDALYKRVYKWPQYGCIPAKRVTRVQQMLVKLGYKTDTDGYFGKTTKEALIKFQKDKGLKADGVAGPATLKALIKAYGTDSYIKKYSE